MLREKVKERLAQAEAVDVQEDSLYGKGNQGDGLPEELRRAQSRLQRIRQGRQALEGEARAAAEADKGKDDDDDAPPPRTCPATPCPIRLRASRHRRHSATSRTPTAES